MNNFKVQDAARSNRWFATTLMFGALVVSAACGSSKSDSLVADPNQTRNPNGVTTVTDGNNNTQPNTVIASCTSSHTNSFTGTASPVNFATSGGNSAAMGTVIYVTNENVTLTDPNKKYKISAYDYDYCDFTYEFGYGSGPLTPARSATFYLVNGTAGAALTAGDYTVGATTGQHVVIANSTVSVSGTSTAGAKCQSTYYAPVSGTIHLDTIPTAADGTRFTAGLAGTFTVTLANGANLGGTFTSGGCAVSNPTDYTQDQTRLNACTCGL